MSPGNTLLADRDEQFLWGKDVLIAPVLDANSNSKTVFFPEGRWIDYHTNRMYIGNMQFNVNAQISRMPIFIRSGAIITMAPDHIPSTATYKYGTLIIRNYYDHQTSSDSATIYKDNGFEPWALSSGSFSFLKFKTQKLGQDYYIECASSGSGYTGMPTMRLYRFELVRYMQPPTEVLWNTVSLPTYTSLNQLYAFGTGYFYDNNQKILHAQVQYTNNQSFLKIIHGSVCVSDYNHPDLISAAYPNPSRGIFSLNIFDFDENSYIEIYDLLGRLKSC